MDKKISIVTGANTGLGYETSLELAKAGQCLVLACRNETKAQEAMSKIKRKYRDADLRFMPLDLIDRTSIKTFADQFKAEYPRLDVLVNNAGVMGPPHTLTPNNLELQFDANHVGHFYLTQLLFDHLKAGEDARIINVSSLAGKRPDADIFFDNLNFEGNYDEGPRFMGLPGMLAYAQSKLANILFTMELKDRLAAANLAIKALVVHPGASNTDLSRNMSLLTRLMIPILVHIVDVSTQAQGAQSSVMAALDPDVQSGDFFGPTGKDERIGKPGRVDLPPKAHDKALCERLWSVSEELLNIEFRI